MKRILLLQAKIIRLLNYCVILMTLSFASFFLIANIMMNNLFCENKSIYEEASNAIINNNFTDLKKAFGMHPNILFNKRGYDGESLVHESCYYSHHGTILVYLLKQGFDPNAVDDYHRTPLHYAAKYGHYREYAKTLVSFGANPHFLDTFGRSPIFYYHISHTNIDFNELAPENDCLIIESMETCKICSSLLDYLNQQKSVKNVTP